LGRRDEYPELRDYLEFLAAAAKDKVPLFKFVRADYRLPWLKQTFPKATLISIRRNPRNSWLSIVSGSPRTRWSDPWLNTAYDLIVWSANLAQHCDFIGTRVGHSYGRSYCLWRISAAVADRYSDVVIDYDRDLLGSPWETVANAFTSCGLKCSDLGAVVSTIVLEQSRKWEDWATEVPFEKIEAECELELRSSGILACIMDGGLENNGWPVSKKNQFPTELLNHLCLEVSESRDVGVMLREAEADRVARGKQIESLSAALKKVEADCSARSEQIESLTAMLQVKGVL
jgi:hypothetical protein